MVESTVSSVTSLPCVRGVAESCGVDDGVVLYGSNISPLSILGGGAIAPMADSSAALFVSFMPGTVVLASRYDCSEVKACGWLLAMCGSTSSGPDRYTPQASGSMS